MKRKEYENPTVEVKELVLKNVLMASPMKDFDEGGNENGQYFEDFFSWWANC